VHKSQISKLINKTNCETDSGHVARTGLEKCIKYYSWKTMNGEKGLKTLRVEGRIILKRKDECV